MDTRRERSGEPARMSVHHFPEHIASTRTVDNELVWALLDPAAYPHPVQNIRHIETHISHLFLTGRFAYKIKKPLKLPFLDYSTAALRRSACDDELRLNRRTAAALYLDVVPIGRTAGGLRIGESGESGESGDVLDYAVQMRQFGADQLFSDLLERGALTAAHIDTLAHTVASFHAQLPPGDAQVASGDPARIHAWTIDNFVTLDDTATPELRVRLHALRSWFDRAFVRLEALLRARWRGGHIRECHGDLHLANVTLIDDLPVLFDCIEFNAALRWIDTISEAAFVFMDLLHGERTDLAYRFLNGYLEHTGDYAGVPLLHYYAAYRALVRAKVAALRARQDHSPDGHAHAIIHLNQYVALAERLTRTGQPWLILTHGLSGSGKTTVAQDLLEQVPALRVRSDVERKRLHGLVSTGASGSALGEGLYAAGATEQTFARLADLARTVLTAGESVIVDATFLRRALRQSFRDLAIEGGVPLAIVTCRAPRSVLEQRVRNRRGDASEADLQVLAHQIDQYEPVGCDEADRCFTLDTDCPPGRLRTEVVQVVAALRDDRP